jgi:hypothetical protein
MTTLIKVLMGYLGALIVVLVIIWFLLYLVISADAREDEGPFTYLMATFCRAATCERTVIASSEMDPRLTMTSCQAVSQAAIAGWMADSIKYRNWTLHGYDCVYGQRRPTA